jgi:predicted ferric reductase
MCVLSFQYFRRNHHSLFFAVHHAFPIVFIASSIHSWALWIYFVPPLLMYLVDRAVLQYRVALFALGHDVCVRSIRTVAGHTVIQLGHRPFTVVPGQYLFVCFPSISLLEYHPFSIAKTEQEVVTIVCKDMGPDSFTGRLASELSEESPCIVDGPHGAPPALEFLARYDSVVLVAGGVGITPIAALLDALLHGPTSPECAVHFVWSVKDPQVFSILPWISAQLRHNERIATLAFHVTGPGHDPAAWDVPGLVLGRPDFDQLLQNVSNGAKNKQSFAFACGPQTMVQTFEKCAAMYKIKTHTENFSF